MSQPVRKSDNKHSYPSDNGKECTYPVEEEINGKTYTRQEH